MFHFTVSIRHPVFLLPEKIEYDTKDKKKVYTATDTLLIDTYNKFASNETYKEKIKPIVDKALGGTLRLFVQKVYEGSYFTRNEETILSVSASLPNGTTLPQMNTLMSRMEAYLSTFKEIRQFQTNVYSARQAGIRIYFTKESERSGFPYTLKSKIISKALELGGGAGKSTVCRTRDSATMYAKEPVLPYRDVWLQLRRAVRMGRTAESQVAHPPPHQGSADQFRILVVERRLPGVLLQPQQSPADPGGHTADRPVRLHQSRFRKGHLYRDDRRQRRDRETETLLPPVTGIRCVEHAVCSTNY